jgi:diguanylate cyclase (GGDEF)-like protein/PAS domain S-box-containing protein
LLAWERILPLIKQTKHTPQKGDSDAVRPPRDVSHTLDSRASAGEQPGNGAETGFVAMALCGRDGRLYHIDPAIVKALGYASEDVQKLHLFSFLADPHDQTTIEEDLKRNTDLRDFQTSLQHVNGKIIPVLLSVHQIDCNGERYMMVLLQGYGRRYEQQQQTEARYHLIFNSVPVGIAIADLQGNLYAFNPAFSDMLGFSAMELRKMTMLSIYRSTEERKRYLETLHRDKAIRNFETVFVHKDGRAINVLLNSDLIKFGTLNNAILSSVRDITVLKSTEAKLIKERDFSEAILDTTESLIMVVGKDGRVIKFNNSCKRLTGFNLADFADRPFWDLLSQNPEKAKALLKRIGQTRERETYESYWNTKDGRNLLIRWATTVLVDEDGNDYIVCSGSDITERRKAHEAVREANRELEKSLRRLEEKNQAISLLADMEGFLQGCRTVKEACTICAQFVQSLCPETSGAVYLVNEANDLAEAQEIWGDESISDTLFIPSNCWSVRRGRMNLIDSNHRGLPCPHIQAVQNGQYLCIPMEVGGDVLGILHVSFISSLAANENPSDSLPYFESRIQLLTTATETAALSLSNIMLQNTLRQLSIRDSLTGLYNRRYMVESLARELSRAHREQVPVSALMFDIDHFKAFNDTYGHDGGDALLRSLGEFLKQNTRGEDIVCRYGGEEFVLVLPNTRNHSAVIKAEALRINVSKLEVAHLNRRMRNCTISIGVASYPQNGQTADELLKAVDDALYTAKREGRNRVVISNK